MMMPDRDTRWDPDNEEFVTDVLMWGVASWTVAVAVLAAFVIYFAVRCLCCVCRNEDCCDSRSRAPASPAVVRLNNAAVSLLLLICAAAGVWLTHASCQIVDSLDGVTGTLIEQVDMFADNTTDVIVTVRNLVPAIIADDPSIAGDVDVTQLDGAEEQLSHSRDMLIDVKLDIRDATEHFHHVAIGIAVGAIICAINGLLCVVTRNSNFLYLYFFFGFFVVFALWVLTGIGITGNRAFVETCAMMELHVAGDRNPTVIEELRCDDLAGGRDLINDAVRSGNEAVNDINAELASANVKLDGIGAVLGHEPLPPLCVPFVLNEADDEYVLAGAAAGCTALQTDAIQAAYGNRVCPGDLPENPDLSALSDPDVSKCLFSGAPTRPLNQARFDDAVDRAADVEQLGSVLPQVYDIIDCAFIDNAFSLILTEECGNLDAYSLRLAVAALISAISLTLTSFYFCVCVQNIRKQEFPKPSEVEVTETRTVTG